MNDFIFCHVFAAEIYKKNSDVLFTLKAYNGRVVLEWLYDELEKFCLDDQCFAVDSRCYHIAAALNLASFGIKNKFLYRTNSFEDRLMPGCCVAVACKRYNILLSIT